MIQYLLFGTSKLLNISDITKRIGNFFKLPIQLFWGIYYPELALSAILTVFCLQIVIHIIELLKPKGFHNTLGAKVILIFSRF